jgi:hypothetical protein
MFTYRSVKDNVVTEQKKWTKTIPKPPAILTASE